MSTQPGCGRPIDVIIVEDDRLARERLQALLEFDRKSVLGVATVREAAEITRTVSAPLIVLDRTAMDGEGLDFCREHRRQHPRAGAGILVLTVDDEPSDASEGLAAGADAYLSKRCTDQEFLDTVRIFLPEKSTPAAPVPKWERERLTILREYAVLDTLAEQAFDDLTLLASRLFDAPIALISLVDEQRQWFKSKVGIDACETDRKDAFCAHALSNPDEVFVVPDARNDVRFRHNPLVTGAPFIRFYAGAPLVTPERHVLGTIAIIDRVPRAFSPQESDLLRALSRQVMLALQQRRSSAALNDAVTSLRKKDEELRRSETLFRTSYENAPIGKALVSIEGKWLRVNQSLCDMLGYRAEELLATDFQSLTHPDDLVLDLAHVNQLLAGSIRKYELEKRYIHKQGHLVWALLSVCLVRDEKDAPSFFVSQIQDRTRRKELERAKEAYIAMVTHELRTPVTAIRGALRLIASGATGEMSEKTESLTALALRNAERLHRVVGDILDLEKIESGELQYEYAAVNLVDLVARAVEEMQPYADQYNVEIRTSFAVPEATVVADADRINQVLLNLLSNAIKYSPEHDAVDVLLSVDGDTARVAVQDHGLGIPEGLRGLVFERFSLANASRSHRKGGSGLGLSISKAIVEHHRGHIHFDTVENRGTTFSFDLPLVPSQ